jgi:hypothetical protein
MKLMEIVPLWTKKIDLNARALDPLGLSRVSEYIVDELLPGLTTLTTRGRNYCFYCWAIQRADIEKPKSYSQFLKIVERLEAAYVVGGILDQSEFFPDAKGPIGRDRGNNAIWTVKNNLIDVNFSVLKHSGGGYGQYYRNPMSKLGLIAQLQKSDALIQDGITLANCFDMNIQQTRYYRKFLSSDEVPQKVLQEYGQFASYLRLKEFKNEQKALSAILFNKNKNLSQNENSRKISLQIILELYKIYSDNQLEFDDSEFRNIIYYHHSQKEDFIIEYHPSLDSTKKTLLQWRFFQFHEFFTFAIESIFICFLDSLQENNVGLTESEFTKTHSGFIKEFSSLLKSDVKKITLDEIFEKILKNNGIKGPLSKKTSGVFDKKVGIDNQLSEVLLRYDLTESLEREETPKVVALSFYLLFTAIIRYWQYLDGFNEDNLWITNKEESEWCLRTYIKRIQPKLSKLTLIDLFTLTLRDIVDTHDTIATKKMMDGNDTFRFQRNEKIFSFKMEYIPESHGDRFYSIKNIFEDIGFIEKKGDLLLISKFGKKILEGIHNE